MEPWSVILQQYKQEPYPLKEDFGFVALPTQELQHFFVQAEEFLSGKKYWLSMGSGDGRVENIAARIYQKEVTAIELSQELITIAETKTAQIIQAIKNPKGRIQFVHGNYVPVALRKERIPPHFNFLHGKDPYRKIKFSSFDLVYSYPWPSQIETVLECFRTCAKKEALLLLYGKYDFDAKEYGLRELKRWDKGIILEKN